MNIHEYQAKALFEKFGVPVPKGTAAKSIAEFDDALAALPEGPTMVKSQILRAVAAKARSPTVIKAA